jgi:type IV secretory pathway TrbD component
VRSAAPDHALLLGQFDGLVGLWVLPWAAAIGLGLWFMRASWVAGARDQ